MQEKHPDILLVSGDIICLQPSGNKNDCASGRWKCEGWVATVCQWQSEPKEAFIYIKMMQIITLTFLDYQMHTARKAIPCTFIRADITWIASMSPRQTLSTTVQKIKEKFPVRLRNNRTHHDILAVKHQHAFTKYSGKCSSAVQHIRPFNFHHISL